MLESAMEVIWDLLIFLALVAVGLIVLNCWLADAETALELPGSAPGQLHLTH
jgi:formate hydrogenlyase subunit 3/multisubunit Na+/H+ antiporter MnhD subunit